MTDAPQERVILETGSIRVTNRRAMLGGKTYSMSNITSVELKKQSPNTLVPIVLLALGVLLALAAIVGGAFSSENINFFCLSIGVVMAVIGGLILGTSKTKYAVRIASASGEADALSSTDQAFIQQVVSAVNEAMASPD